MNMLLPAPLIDDLIQATYFIAALLFIIGLKRMSSPKGAKNGIVWAGIGMLIAGLITFLWPGMHNYILIIVAIFIGGVLACRPGTDPRPISGPGAGDSGGSGRHHRRGVVLRQPDRIR